MSKLMQFRKYALTRQEAKNVKGAAQCSDSIITDGSKVCRSSGSADGFTRYTYYTPMRNCETGETYCDWGRTLKDALQAKDDPLANP